MKPRTPEEQAHYDACVEAAVDSAPPIPRAAVALLRRLNFPALVRSHTAGEEVAAAPHACGSAVTSELADREAS